MDKEMELLLSEKEITLDGKQVIVKRIALLDTMRLTTHLSDVVSSVLSNESAFNKAMGKILFNGNENSTEADINSIKALGIVEMIGLIGEDGADFIRDLILKSTNLSSEDVEKIDCLSGIDLLTTIYEVNKSFFVKCMSKLKELLEKKSQKSAKKTK